MRIFIISPALATGGTELLHQFSQYLTQNGIENYMIYPDYNGVQCPTPPTFLKYGVKYVSHYIDSPDTVLVLTETQLHLAAECRQGTLMVWWLSVDNYSTIYRDKIQNNNIDIWGLRNKSNIIHFAQSYYARDFVNTYFSPKHCYFLMDYINDDIINWAISHKDNYQRQNICLYNPRKGYEALTPIIAACREDITWIPLTNMTPIEMADIMCKAKLYIDFGSHPGKDRIPREAAICGCCVLTNRKGSAAYSNDVNIPEKFKIKDPGQVEAVLKSIYDLIDNYDSRTAEYSAYRENILAEKNGFFYDAQQASLLLQCIALEKTVIVPASQLIQHVDFLDSINSAALTINQLTDRAKRACSSGDSSELVNSLLDIDYILQLIRETVYLELTIDAKQRLS